MPQVTATASAFRPFVLAWLVMLLAVFTCLAVNGVGLYHFSADELMHLDIARGTSISEVVRFSRFEPHPPLGHLLRHYWIMASENPAYVRSESLLFGILTILTSYRIGAYKGGALAGICTAAFAAFCPALILQSYLVRNYAFFAFFISLTFYCYLRWQGQRERRWLIRYTLAGTLACLTHLSGLFAIAAIGAFELIGWRQRRGTMAELGRWITAHIPIGVTAIAVWWMLLPLGIAPFEDYSRSLSGVQWVLAFLYPQQALGFLLPFPGHFQSAYWLLLGIMSALAAAGYCIERFRPALGMLTVALLLGVLLRAGNFYPFMDARHVLWLLPFLILCCGWALAIFIAWLQERLAVPPAACALALVFAGWALYAPELRFRQVFEYQITEPEWQVFAHYLSDLPPDRLIVARRADALLIDPPGENPYRFMGAEAPLITTVPYAHTQILFDPTRANSAHYLDDLPLRMIREAEDKGLLKDVDTLVFVNSAWTSRISRIMVRLVTCKALPKTVYQISDAPPPARPSVRIYSNAVTLMLVNKQTFLDQVLAKNGEARKACLE